MHVETITVGWSWEDGLKINLSFTKIPLRSRCLECFHRVSLELLLSGGGEVFWWQKDLQCYFADILCHEIMGVRLILRLSGLQSSQATAKSPDWLWTNECVLRQRYLVSYFLPQLSTILFYFSILAACYSFWALFRSASARALWDVK